jgi:hypothetical protein
VDGKPAGVVCVGTAVAVAGLVAVAAGVLVAATAGVLVAATVGVLVATAAGVLVTVTAAVPVATGVPVVGVPTVPVAGAVAVPVACAWNAVTLPGSIGAPSADGRIATLPTSRSKQARTADEARSKNMIYPPWTEPADDHRPFASGADGPCAAPGATSDPGPALQGACHAPPVRAPDARSAPADAAIRRRAHDAGLGYNRRARAGATRLAAPTEREGDEA